jgi:serine/threonine protein kinase
LVSEYADGGSLSGKLQHQIRLSEMETLSIGVQAALALQTAQRYGLLHGNLNPANILYVENRLVVGDFGQTTPVDQARRNSSALLAAEEYLAPERLALQDEDFRSDIYSLGATMFRCLTGRVVRAPQAAIRAGRQSEFIALGPTLRDVSKPTVKVIHQMLAEHPRDRFQSYDELVEALQEAQQARNIFADVVMPKVEEKEEAVIAKPKLPLVPLGIGLALLIIGSLVAFGIMGRTSKPRNASPAIPMAAQNEVAVPKPASPPVDTRPILQGSVMPSSTLPYDLTRLGKLDWAHWNGKSIHKSTGNHLISDLTPIGKGEYGIWKSATLAVTWSDGYPVPEMDVDHGHVWCRMRADSGWTFTAAAGPEMHTLTVLYGGAEKAKVKIAAELSDHSAPDFSDIQAINDSTFRLATFVYRAKSASQQLKILVTKVQDSNAPSVDLSAAWMEQ